MTGLLVDAAGWAGAAALLLAYALVSTGRLVGRSTGFHVLNLVGSVGLLVNGIWHGAWPSAALNALWLAIGLVALVHLTVAPQAPATAASGTRESSPGSRGDHGSGASAGAGVSACWEETSARS